MSELSSASRPPAPSPQPPPTPAEEAAVARHLTTIEARYGERLDDAGRAVLAARLLEFQRHAAALRRVALTAADEPLPTFVPRPAGGPA